MKTTNFHSLCKAIKALELKELKAALAAHGGRYTFPDKTEDGAVFVAINQDSGPVDARITEATLSSTGHVCIKGVPTDTNEEGIVFFDDIEVGHTEYIISAIKPTAVVESVKTDYHHVVLSLRQSLFID